MKTTLWIPGVDRPPWPCVDSWMNIDWPRGDGNAHNFVRSGANNIRYSWNKVIRDFLASDFDYLWSCHNDVYFHPGTLKRLLSWGKPLVSATMFSRGGTVFPMFWEGTEPGQKGYHYKVRETVRWYRQHDDDVVFGAHLMEPAPEDSLFRVDFASTGCLLMHRSVLESMTDPWFLWDDDYKGGGEDRFFCENARAAGFETYVDRSCIAGHLGGDIPVALRDFMVDAMVMVPDEFVDAAAVAAAKEVLARGKKMPEEEPKHYTLEVQDSVMGASAVVVDAKAPEAKKEDKDNG